MVRDNGVTVQSQQGFFRMYNLLQKSTCSMLTLAHIGCVTI